MHVQRLRAQLAMDFGVWRLFLALIIGGILVLCTSCYSEQAPKYSFVKQGATAPPISYYDYIVVGGGTAGCALASTLSQSSDVLLLERGGVPYGNRNVEDMGRFNADLQEDTPTSPSQRFISEDGVINARARVLGGGSAINAGFYTRASHSYVAEAGWDQALVNRSYAWVEKKVAFEPPMLQFQSAVRDGLLEVGVQPYNGFTFEHIYGTKVGGTIFDRNGKRHTAADLLEYADPKRTTVYLHSTAHKILFSSDDDSSKLAKGSQKPIRAVGVLFADAQGTMHRAFLRPPTAAAGTNNNEVILSAGALGSPQLLMLSGIGPADELALHGIPVILNQPMVGQGMADNPMNGIFITSPTPVETSLIQVVGITTFGSYIEASSGSTFAGAFTHNLPQANDMFPPRGNNPSASSDDKAPSAADLAKSYEFVQALANGTIDGGMILEKIMGPSSKGFLRLTTTNPNDNPSVIFNYFQEPEDLEMCVKGMDTILKVIASESFTSFRMPFQTPQTLMSTMLTMPLNLRPKHLDSAFSLEQFCRDTVMTIWHYHGGCLVGKVVDEDYKVIGVDALRVVDGSTFHSSPGTNPQATVMMLGRYLGQRILEKRGTR